MDDLVVRRFREGDAAAVFDAVSRNREHLTPFMHWMVPDYSLQMAKEFIQRAVEGVEKKELLGLGIFEGDRLLGSIGYTSFEWTARRTEIGYWIDRELEGRGLVTRVCIRLIDHAFEELDLNRVEIRCSVENLRSAAIPRRLGFQQEGLLRQSEVRHGKLHNFLIFGLLRDEWRSKKDDNSISIR